MFFFLLLFWIILNGKITGEILLTGVIMAAFFAWFANRFLNYKMETEKKLWKNAGLLLEYLAFLIVEIVKANLTVLKILLTPGRKIHPVLVHFKAPLKKEFLKVILADSITLTPGTITVRLNEDGYTVHCLDESLAKGLDSSVFVKILKKMEDQ